MVFKKAKSSHVIYKQEAGRGKRMNLTRNGLLKLLKPTPMTYLLQHVHTS